MQLNPVEIFQIDNIRLSIDSSVFTTKRSTNNFNRNNTDMKTKYHSPGMQQTSKDKI